MKGLDQSTRSVKGDHRSSFATFIKVSKVRDPDTSIQGKFPVLGKMLEGLFFFFKTVCKIFLSSAEDVKWPENDFEQIDLAWIKRADTHKF